MSKIFIESISAGTSNDIATEFNKDGGKKNVIIYPVQFHLI